MNIIISKGFHCLMVRAPGEKPVPFKYHYTFNSLSAPYNCDQDYVLKKSYIWAPQLIIPSP